MMKRLTDLEKALLNRVLEIDGEYIGFKNKDVKAAAWDELKNKKMDNYPFKVFHANSFMKSDLFKSIADRERKELLYMDKLDGTNEARDLIKRIDAKVDVEG